MWKGAGPRSKNAILGALAVSLMLARESSCDRQLNKKVSEQQSRIACISGDLMIVMESPFAQWRL